MPPLLDALRDRLHPGPEGAEQNPQHPRFWELLRFSPGEVASGASVQGWFETALRAIAYCLQQAGASEGGAGGAVLDVSAGSGALDALLQKTFPALIVHATEQSSLLAEGLTRTLDDAPVAVWRCDQDTPPDDLRVTLAASTRVFLPYYPVVLLHHVVDCVSHETGYRLLDAAWEMVQPADAATGRQGFLVVAVQRNLYHRVHPAVWSWDHLVGYLAQKSRPVIAFDDALGGSSIVAAIWRPASGTPTYPAAGELRP